LFDVTKYVHSSTELIHLFVWLSYFPTTRTTQGPAVTPARPAGYFGGPNEANEPLRPNPYSWTKATDVIFIEQPVGVGFSYGGPEPRTEADVANDLYGFLQNFYETFPGTRDKRLILSGES
jgi:Serine carboxypeptidase